MRKDSFMIRFRDTISEARQPAVIGRACQDNANARRQSVRARMTDVMLELGFAGQPCDEAMLRLHNFTDPEIAAHAPGAAADARKRSIRRVDGAPASGSPLKGGAVS